MEIQTTAETPLRLLVIEDSEDDYRLLLHELGKSGLPCSSRRVDDEGGVVEAFRHPWDLVVSDFSMPSFCGLRALQHFVRSGLEVPFIILSGTIGEESAVAAMKAGASDYIMKSQMAKVGPAVRRELDAASNRRLRRDAERRLRDSEERLRQAQEMESVGRMAGGIAHDFNNMLSVIGFHCEKLLQSTNTDVVRSAVKIKSIQERAAIVTKRLLTFSRETVPATEELDLSAMAAGMAEVLQNLLGSGIVMNLDLKDGLPTVKAERLQLEQALMNLALNARDAMQCEGHLTIRTRHLSLAEERRIGRIPLRPGPYVVMDVADSGRGIGADILERIFEPYFTTKAPGKGTGLGLSWVLEIVHQCGGAIEVNSPPDAGATFSIYLPASLTPAAAVFSATTTPKTEGSTVLLLEDDDELCELLTETLRLSGYHVQAFSDGQKALDWLEEKSPETSLIISDLSPLETPGAELLERMRHLSRHRPFLLISGHVPEDFALAHENPSLFAHLEKPFEPGHFMRKVRSLAGEGVER